MDIYLVDGTYELFRHYYALPSARDSDGCEVAAVRGVLASVLGMIKGGATHIAVATDHVIESFRNELWPGYKTGEGIEPDLLAQFPLLEEVLSAAGIVVWPMVEFEADDALAAAAVAAARDARVERVILCTPDKDLAQCVRGTRIVQLNRRTRVTLDEAGLFQKFGISPASDGCEYIKGSQTRQWESCVTLVSSGDLKGGVNDLGDHKVEDGLSISALVEEPGQISRSSSRTSQASSSEPGCCDHFHSWLHGKQC